MRRTPRPRWAAIGALVLVMTCAVPAYGVTSRSLVMARAERWVDATVPYSQAGWADDSAAIVGSALLGWRRDCSGFASMCWSLPTPGATSSTIQSYAEPVTKEALQPGDLMVSEGVHAVVFGGWTDESRTAYWAYEMSRSQSDETGDGSVKRAVTYPYWGDDASYLPWRLVGITGNIDYGPYVTPIEGADRYTTAVAASAAGWEAGGAPSVIVASGEDWPDALGAAALAGAIEGPVLLTRRDALPGVVAAEIGRLGAHEVIIVGGPAAVSEDVASAITAIGSLETTRIGGADRYATSAAIAREARARAAMAGRADDGAAFLATGTDFPDALAASPIAYAHVTPILLTRPEALSPDAAQALVDLARTSALVLGGPAAVADDVMASASDVLGADSVSRIAGSDRFRTALAIAAHADDECCLEYTGCAIAGGEGFADALAGGVMAGRLGTPLLLTPGAWLHPDVGRLLSADPERIGSVRCVGGTAVVQPIVRESVALMLQ